MVEETVGSGRRVAELLSSELSGRSDSVFGAVSVTNPDLDVTGSPQGERAYDIEYGHAVLGSVYVHEERARLVLEQGVDAARSAATEPGLRVRGRGGPSPAVLVFLEDGAAVKQVLPVVRAAITAAFEPST